MSDHTTHPIHEGHDHTHGEGCGHDAITHGDHVDYDHDGHLHHQHGDHVEECDRCQCATCDDFCATCECRDCTCATCEHAA